MALVPDADSEYISEYDDIVNASDDQSGALTFGVDLQFLVASVDDEGPDPTHGESRPLLRTPEWDDEDIMMRGEVYDGVKNHIVDILNCEGELPIRYNGDGFYPPYNDYTPIYGVWRISCERSSIYEDETGPYPYLWHGREISSVIMSSDDPTYPTEIEKVCRTLRQARIHLDETTSLYVHVGPGKESFSLLTVKKFATLYWLTEEKILSLHHPCRQSNRDCFFLTRMSKLATETSEEHIANERFFDTDRPEHMHEFVPSQLPTLLEAQLRQIWACTKIEELELLMNKGPTVTGVYTGSVGFERLLPTGKNPRCNTKSFEWRQMAGCLDPNSIIQWARVCIAFTDFARTSSAEEFNRLLITILELGSSYTGFHLLKSLGLHTEAEFFKKKVDGYAENQELYPGQSAGNLFVPPL
ncbi:hypothetical protein F4809DRAFT_660029 [Biscogniauxia mediterranea]|nr:hypothetical protein F4809DRAFT_660029 [Biscogniauxia mediterranea]